MEMKYIHNGNTINVLKNMEESSNQALLACKPVPMISRFKNTSYTDYCINEGGLIVRVGNLVKVILNFF